MEPGELWNSDKLDMIGFTYMYKRVFDVYIYILYIYNINIYINICMSVCMYVMYVMCVCMYVSM